MEFLRQHQLNIMLMLIGVCGILAFLVLFTKTLSPRRKCALMCMELGSMGLLIADRLAYLYRGNLSDIGYWMVRLSNFSVFFLSLFIIFGFDIYLIDLYTTEGELKRTPVRLKLSVYCFFIGVILLIIAHFKGFYYTFDSLNRYHRSSGFFISYIIPLIVMFLQFSVIIQYYNRISKTIRLSIILFITLPFVASFVQIFTYGLSLINITVVGAAVMFYVFVILDMNHKVELANQREIELLKEEQRHTQLMFIQTAEALASAIDAKDCYTHGHSKRVANYSKKIAKLAGKSEKECNEIYFAALLHDVGKIGVSDAIINKTGDLTNDEYSTIKKHPLIGQEILSHIKKSTYIGVGAKYHYERYDGNGYPYGLKGSQIPEVARIIAIADAYDAMTSNRSYREVLSQEKVREEIETGIGTQFDPKFANIMLRLIDDDKDFSMKETPIETDNEDSFQ